MDPTFTLLWQRYRAWATTSARLKSATAKWKRRVLILTVAGTALATLGPFARDAAIPTGWLLPVLGSAALAIATYLGKELLDTQHEEAWTRARAAAEIYKSEAAKYAVQAPPYAGENREQVLRARLEELATLGKGLPADSVAGAAAIARMPATFWTATDYVKNRLDDQIEFYRRKAAEHTAVMTKGRVVSLLLGGSAALLSLATGAAPERATLIAAVLGVVTTTGGAVGAYFHASHFEAIALKYRETADALELLKLDLNRVSTPEARGGVVTKAEAIMQAENAAWMMEMASAASGASGSKEDVARPVS